MGGPKDTTERAKLVASIEKNPSWEKNHPERKEWTSYISGLISDNLSTFLGAKDVKLIHPNILELERNAQITLLVEFFSRIALHESSWRPEVSVVDVGNPLDKDTWSSGLFQVSVKNQKDYGLKYSYTYTQILTPRPNMDIAVAIMINQIRKVGLIFVPVGGTYLNWATIHPGGKYDQTKAIVAATQAMYPINIKPVEKPVESVDKPTTPIVHVSTESNMMKVYDIAYKEKGVSEIVGAKDNPRIVEYHKATTLPPGYLHDEVPWCASFVSWCLEQAGLKSTNDASAISYAKYGTKLDVPTKGCICVFSREGGNHVAFFDHQIGNDIYVLGGNQSNMVCIKAEPKSRLLGFRSY
jgi:uncharacterized protein (TIGR02594 family)